MHGNVEKTDNSVQLKNHTNVELEDITKIKIDTARPVSERIKTFMEQIRDPYNLKVGDIAVRVRFLENEPTLQKKMELFLIKKL